MKRTSFFYGYIIAGACFVIQALGLGTYIAFGVFFKPLLSDFGWTRATLSGAQSLALLIMGLLGIFVGRLNDRFGPRIVMTVTGFLFGLGFLLMSGLTAVWQLYVFYGIVVGMGMSSFDVIALSTTARWFVRRRGIMTGLVKVGTGAGQMTIPFAASMFIADFGWRTSYIIIGAFVMLMLMAVAQFLRRDPAYVGLLPDGDTRAVKSGPSPMEIEFSLHEALRTRPFWTICLSNLFVVFCLLIIMVHIVPHATDIDISATAAAGILSTIGGISMVGRFTTGIAIDRIGNRRSMIICFILLIAVLLWLQLAKELWMLYLFALVYGFAHGGFFTVISPIVAEYFGLRSHGILFGIVACAGTVGGAVGPILAGHVFDTTGEYSLAFWVCTVVSILGLGLISSLRPAKPGAEENREKHIT
jgi:MFS family permease